MTGRTSISTANRQMSVQVSTLAGQHHRSRLGAVALAALSLTCLDAQAAPVSYTHLTLPTICSV